MIVKNIKTECTHCGLPVPAGLLQSRREEQFCCNGCSAAWQLIHASGLDSFYRMADTGSDQTSLRGRLEEDINDHQFAEFDEPRFLSKFSARHDNGVSNVRLSLDGIHCAACVWLIEKLPTIVEGTVDAKVNWSRRTVEVSWQPDQVQLSIIAYTLHKLGYTPHPISENKSADRRKRENRKQLTQIGIAAAAAGNNMIIAAALYFGMFSYMSFGMETMLRIASCIVGIASFLGPGRVFLRGAANAVKTWTPHMDLPIAVGLTVGSIAGLVNTVRGVGEIYFDSLSILICLLLIGRWIQFRQQNCAADAVEMLYRLTPQRARKILGDSVVDVAVDDLQPNDVIEIRPGDLIAVDGFVIDGRSQVDESILTGESRSVKKLINDEVFAGTKNINSLLTVRISATESQTRIGSIMELVEHAATNKPRIVQWANQIGGYFVVTVLGLAFATFVAWMMIDSSRAVDRAVALLIVACPCALAMATPLAISVALGRLAKQKILVKDGDVLQSLSRPGIVWFDKTGTLTEGRLKFVKWHGDQSWLPIVAEIESRFNHPIADAFVEFANVEFANQQVREPKHEEQTGPGTIYFGPELRRRTIRRVEMRDGGISAIVDEKEILIGNRRLIEQSGKALPGQVSKWISLEAEILAQQFSTCWIAVDGIVVALVALGDSIRTEANEVIGELRRLGWEIGILSGDHREIVNSVAATLDIEHVHAGVTPTEKLEIVRESTTDHDTTVMIGDGVNDSAALAAATVGVAVNSGAEASLAAAPVFLGTPGLSTIRDLIQSSRSTTRTIRINLAASLFYNIIGVGLAMIGFLNPLVAAILMPISSLTVVSLSILSATKSEPSN